MPKTVMPHPRPYQRARSRALFNQLFQPTENGRLREVSELPPNPNERHWWTVVDLDPDGKRFYLLPGFRFANKLGFVETDHAWGGAPEDHPLYTY